MNPQVRTAMSHMHDVLHFGIIGRHNIESLTDEVFFLCILLICVTSPDFSECVHARSMGVRVTCYSLLTCTTSVRNCECVRAYSNDVRS